MTTQLLVPILLSVLLAVYLGIAVRTWTRLRGTRVVTCPETKRPAGVTVDLGHATTSAIWEHADVRIGTCSRWPERHPCDETCVAQIEASTEDTRASTMAARFFEGRRCVICRRRIEPLKPVGLQPGFMNPVTREAVAWPWMPPERLPEAIAGQRPLCPACTLAESSRAFRVSSSPPVP